MAHYRNHPRHAIMAPVPRAEWQNALRAAIEERYGSLNGYARHLAGPNATEKQIGSKRRGVMKWLAEKKPVVPSAPSVAALLADGVDFDTALLPTPTKPHHHTTEELVAMMVQAREAQDRMWTELERIASAVARIEKSLRSLLEAQGIQPRRRRSNG